MSTPHNGAARGDIAKTVLMPGDPLRAKFIAQTYFDDMKQFNSVRGMLGFTGTYKGKPVSVMGSGMGMPSIGIYSYELFNMYDVEEIIRVGSAGAYTADLELYDIVLATSAYSESTFAQTQNGTPGHTKAPDADLCRRLRQSAEKLGIPLREGTIHSSDIFYYGEGPDPRPVWQRLNEDHGCLAVEMESYALFHNAQVSGKRAATLVTISDQLVSEAYTTAEEREKSLTNMMEVALGVL